jgi:hypothetical protein
MEKQIPERLPIYLPQTWADDLDKLLTENSTVFKRHERDYLLYIGQLPYYLATRVKEKEYWDGYIPINKTLLSGRVHNYRKYLDFLLTNEMLDEDRQYIVGEKSRGLRYPNYYVTQPTKKCYLTKYTLIKSLTSRDDISWLLQEGQVEESVVERYEYLKKWLNPKLKIDIGEAEKILTQLRMEEEANPKPRHWSTYKIGKSFRRSASTLSDYNDAWLRYNSRHIIIQKIFNQDFSTARADKTSGRFHSHLTRIKKEVRKTITYDGQKLVTVDIVNSQPFFLIGLLDPFVFSNNTLDLKVFKYNPNLSWNLPELLEKIEHKSYNYTNNLKLNTNWTTNKPNYLNYTLKPNENNQTKTSKKNIELKEINNMGTSMFVNFISKIRGQEDVKKYIDWVVSGTFYEEFGRELNDRHLIPCDRTKPRDAAKDSTFEALFGKTNAESWSGPARAFKAVFPTINDLIKVIKYGKVSKKERPYASLALTMQAFEAELILQHCCGTIAYERPDLPIFTIHDSIVTTVGNEWFVKDVMESNFKNIIGYVPQLKFEYW